jgi:hypothetical protein
MRRYIGDAQPESGDFYSGLVRLRETWQIVSHCQHKHRSRDTAERCGDLLAKGCDVYVPVLLGAEVTA